MTTADIIKELRHNVNMTQDEMAQALFVTRQAVSRWENGDITPNLETLKQISKMFGISLNHLLATARNSDDTSAEINADRFIGFADIYENSRPTIAERTFIAQLTDTHCRFLAESHISGGVKKCYTFLDGDEFIPNWGFGENNCGNEVNLSVKGDIIRNGSEITAADKPFLLDVVGRYEVKIGGKSYDTICVMDIETYDGGVVSEQYLDKNGRTILWRRFNRNDWAKDRYKKNWTEILPENERITVNGEVYVHWYNCITDYIL